MSTLQTTFLKHPDAAGNQITFTSGGNTGIGTASAAGVLHVNGSAEVAIIGSSSRKLYFRPDAAGVMLTTGASQTGNGFYFNESSNSIYAQTNTLQRVTIDSSGRVLVNTTSAATLTGGVESGTSGIDGTSTTLNLENSVPGFYSKLVDNNDANRVVGYWFNHGGLNAGIASTRTATNQWGTDLRFYTHKAAVADQHEVYERLRISSEGRVSIGTATVTAKVSIWENAATNEPVRINDTNNTNAHTHRISFRTGDVEAGKITSDRTSTNYVTTSDYRLKENVVDIADGIARVKQLQPNRFNFIADPDKTVDGFLAHEVQTIVPEAITGQKDAVDDEGNPEYQGIDQSKLVPLLTAALQEAIAKIETLEQRLSDAGIA